MCSEITGRFKSIIHIVHCIQLVEFVVHVQNEIDRTPVLTNIPNLSNLLVLIIPLLVMPQRTLLWAVRESHFHFLHFVFLPF